MKTLVMMLVAVAVCGLAACEKKETTPAIPAVDTAKISAAAEKAKTDAAVAVEDAKAKVDDAAAALKK